MNKHYNTIINMLEGTTEHPDLDWEGLSEVLDLYERSTGRDRTSVIKAMGEVLDTGSEHPIVAAQVLSLVNALDLTELQPSVEKLANMNIKEPVLSKEIRNYFGTRELVSSPNSIVGG